MKRVLMVLAEGTLDAAHSGASSRYLQNAVALKQLFPELHLLRVCREAEMARYHAYEAGLNGAMPPAQRVDTWTDVVYDRPVHQTGRLNMLVQSLTDPVGFQFPNLPPIRRAIQESIACIKPDLLWLEGSTLLAAAGRPGIPTVYSHTDLAYRVMAVRHTDAGLRQRYFFWIHRRAEEQVTRKAQHVLTGSETDARRMRELGCRHVVTIPIGYEHRPGPPPDAQADTRQLRVIHLGSLETTANRIGLMQYLEQAHQVAVAGCVAAGSPLVLWVIGDNSRIHPALAEAMSAANIYQAGFVPDLSTVLRPYDVAILPYEHDTGYRTKLPLLFSFAQVVLATKAAVAGTQMAGLADVCVIVDSVKEFPATLKQLAARPGERVRRGQAAYHFFIKHFTHEAIFPQYARFLKQVLEAKA